MEPMTMVFQRFLLMRFLLMRFLLRLWNNNLNLSSEGAIG
jgi:hypothetical protein